MGDEDEDDLDSQSTGGFFGGLTAMDRLAGKTTDQNIDNVNDDDELPFGRKTSNSDSDNKKRFNRIVTIIQKVDNSISSSEVCSYQSIEE